MSDFWPYEPCPGCSGAAQPGTVALLNYLLNRFPGTRSLGIYNCRDQRGGKALSIHACGRAGDDGIPLDNGDADTELGDPIVRLLIEFAHELGIMGIIWNRVRYDAKSPRGRVYTGLVPHKDHIHFEQTASLAATLTYSDIERICGDSNLLPLTANSPDEDIRMLQHRLNVAFDAGLVEDAVWGPATSAAVAEYTGSQTGNGTWKNGGGVGEAQWDYLDGEWIRAHAAAGPPGPRGEKGDPGPAPTSVIFRYE